MHHLLPPPQQNTHTAAVFDNEKVTSLCCTTESFYLPNEWFSYLAREINKRDGVAAAATVVVVATVKSVGRSVGRGTRGEQRKARAARTHFSRLYFSRSESGSKWAGLYGSRVQCSEWSSSCCVIVVNVALLPETD